MGRTSEYAVELHNDCVDIVGLLEKHKEIPVMNEALEMVKKGYIAVFGEKEIFWEAKG